MSKIKKMSMFMRKGNKTKPEEIISILRSIEVLMSEGKSLELACRKAQIARQTYYRAIVIFIYNIMVIFVIKFD